MALEVVLSGSRQGSGRAATSAPGPSHRHPIDRGPQGCQGPLGRSGPGRQGWGVAPFLCLPQEWFCLQDTGPVAVTGCEKKKSDLAITLFLDDSFKIADKLSDTQ